MFQRQIEVIGESGQRKLAESRVLIVGAGGLGCSLISILGCIGLQEIVIVDPDFVELHNLHRQLLFTRGDIGKPKSVVAADRGNRCGVTKFTPIVARLEEVAEELEPVDLIFDGTDNFESRHFIDRVAKRWEIPWILAGVEEWRGQVALLRETELAQFLSGGGVGGKGQFPPVVTLVASLAAQLGLKELLTGPLPEELFYLDAHQTLSLLNFKL